MLNVTGFLRAIKLKRNALLATLFAAGIYAAPATAQQFVYTPLNPSFGGNPFNSSHLLGIATAQNRFRDPDLLARQNSSPTDLFVRQLQSRLLSGLASQVTEAIFGENPQDSGEIVFGDQTIIFSRGLESVSIIIEDNETGTRTEIEIPLLTGGEEGQSQTTTTSTTSAQGTSQPSATSVTPSFFDPILGNDSILLRPTSNGLFGSPMLVGSQQGLISTQPATSFNNLGSGGLSQSNGGILSSAAAPTAQPSTSTKR